MIAVCEMQMTINQVINVIAMRDRLMPAPRSMAVTLLVTLAIVFRRAPAWIL
jgi:hypothetical protein